MSRTRPFSRGTPPDAVGDGRPEPAAAGDDAREPLAVGVPLGGIIPRKLVNDPHLVVLNRPTTHLAERYRRLRLQLPLGAAGSSDRRTYVVTSPMAGEGKTTTALNLALAAAEDPDHSTLLVDADLRRPGVAQYLAPKPTLGLSEILSGPVRVEQALLKVRNSRLTILPAGKATSNPTEILRAERLAQVIAELRRDFDTVIVDTPPTVPFTDAAVLSKLADGTILVVRARRTTRPLIEKALESLAGCLVLGMVLNDVRFSPVDRYYYQYDDYLYGEPGEPSPDDS